jgi:hypothetical protein
LLDPLVSSAAETRQRRDESPHEIDIGFVYLLRSGRFFKIGKTNAHGRRERELAIQLPEKANSVHVIRTDDPMGSEAAGIRVSLRHGGTGNGSNSMPWA